MKRKTKIETKYSTLRYRLKSALLLLESLLKKETDNGILTTSQERAEIERFIASTRREARFK